MSGDEDELERIRRLTEQGAAAAAAEEPAPLSPVQALFGRYFSPGQFGFAVGKGTLGDRTVIYLTMETSHGRQAFPLSNDEAIALGRKLMEEATGIVIAQGVPGVPRANGQG